LARALPLLAAAGLLGLLVWQLPAIGRLLVDLRRNPTAYLFAFPAVAVIFAVIVFPFVWNIVLSLSDMSLTRFRDWQIVGFQNYAEVLTDPRLWGLGGVFLKTIIWTVVNVVLHVALGVMLAVALNGPVRGKAIYRLLLIIPWAVPAYITALTWRGMFDYEYGAVNLALGRWLGLPAVNWLGEPLRAFEACVITNVWLGFPFMMVIALGGLQGIPQELYEAARIDRAGRWQQFWHITLPLLKPVLLPAATLGAIWTFNNLNVIWLVSNGGEPQDSTHILVSYVYKSVFNLYRYGYGAALSMVMFLILLAVSLVLLRRSRATDSVYG
jgi:arabinogalactan oligomer/maltooligosaccharide transport system permease protein